MKTVARSQYTYIILSGAHVNHRELWVLLFDNEEKLIVPHRSVTPGNKHDINA